MILNNLIQLHIGQGFGDDDVVGLNRGVGELGDGPEKEKDTPDSLEQ